MTSYEHTHPFWAARLSTVIAMNLRDIERGDVKADFKRTLDDFIRSSVPSEELKDSLREEMRR